MCTLNAGDFLPTGQSSKVCCKRGFIAESGSADPKVMELTCTQTEDGAVLVNSDENGMEISLLLIASKSILPSFLS